MYAAMTIECKSHLIIAFFIVLLSEPSTGGGARKAKPARSSDHDPLAMPTDLQRFQKSRTYSELVDLLMKQVMDKFDEKSSQDGYRDSQTANEVQASEDDLQMHRYRQGSSEAQPSTIDKAEPVKRWRLKNGGNTTREAKHRKLLEPRRTTKEPSQGANRTGKRDKMNPTTKGDYRNEMSTTVHVEESVERIEVLLEDPFENQAEFNPKNRMFKIP